MDKNIQYILEVARCGGITRAAEKLYITPSALSKFVQAREEEMNIRLFRRLAKSSCLQMPDNIMYENVRKLNESKMKWISR